MLVPRDKTFSAKHARNTPQRFRNWNWYLPPGFMLMVESFKWLLWF